MMKDTIQSDSVRLVSKGSSNQFCKRLALHKKKYHHDGLISYTGKEESNSY